MFKTPLIQQTNRYASALRKLLSIKGEAQKVSFGVHLEDERPEFSFTKTETLWAQTGTQVSGAADLSRQGIVNPANSGIITVITGVNCSVEAAGVTIRLGYLTPIAGIFAGTSMHTRDTRTIRSPAAPQATTSTFFQSLGAVTGFLGIVEELVSLAADQPMDFVAVGARIPNFVLAPNSALYLAPSAVGVHTLRVNFSGYERSLESGELISG